MKLIIGARGTGKTTKLVKEACISGATIVVPYHCDIGYITHIFLQLKKDNPLLPDLKKIITIDEYCSWKHHAGRRDERFMFSDLDRCLKSISGGRAVVLSASFNEGYPERLSREIL